MMTNKTIKKCVSLYTCVLDSFNRHTPDWLLGLIARFGIAAIFWRSGRTKVHDIFSINDMTYFLFREEYKVPLLPPDLAAVMATVSEHFFPILLVIGLASRLSAFALLGMTSVIQTFVYPGSWPDHLLWASALVYIIARGPGSISLDNIFRKKYAPQTTCNTGNN